jgi:methionyl aminopeptidase
MRHAGRSAAGTLSGVQRILRPGLSTAEIDRFVRRDAARRGGTPAQLGDHGFPASVCTSRNHVVCHGIPSPTERLEEGDLLNVDVTTCLGGWLGDTSRTFLIGAASPEARHVVEVAERCLWAGIEAVRPGRRLGEVGAAIEALTRAEGCSVVTDFGGHGIGRARHLPPHVSHVGPAGKGPVLRRAPRC